MRLSRPPVFAPPRAAAEPVRVELHGIERVDPYAWLRDTAWQEVMREPSRLRREIREHLEAENAHTAAVLEPTADLQRALFEEMKGRIKEDDSSVPARHGPWAYYSRYEHGAQHPKFCRRAHDDANAAEQVLLDGDIEAAGKVYFRLGSVAHSPDHAILAYAVDNTGSEFYEVAFKDLATGALLPDRIPDTAGGVVWANDSRTVFYTVLDAQHRPCKIFRHVLGTAQADDVLVYEETDPGFFLGLGVTENHGYIVLDAHDHTTSEVRLVDANHPTAEPKLIAARQPGIEYEVAQQGDTLVILTNADGAEDFKVVRTPAATPEPAHWVELVPHVGGRLILGVMCFADHIVRLEREAGLPRIVIRRADGFEHAIAFDEPAYSLGLVPGYEHETKVVRLAYSSMTTPEQTFDYDMDSRERTLLKTQEVPSGHDPTRYRSARLMAGSHDGEEVPVSLLWHEDTPIDGTAPVLLYGYGSYGLTIPAGFGTARLSLVDRGFIWALAHIRGGKDKGYAWYREGKLHKKVNTFLDFVAAAEHLCTEGWCRPGNITIEGGSAGGMLVGAVANMRPELWRAVVAEVPFVDVLNTMCDPDLPLTPPEWPEWGNPVLDPAAYATIAAYSPYDNVRAQAYPHILATAGLTDPRVTYWEPAKWVARLRELKTDDNMLLLRTYMEAGHAGKAGRFEKLEEVALAYAFVLLAHDRVDEPPRPRLRTATPAE